MFLYILLFNLIINSYSAKIYFGTSITASKINDKLTGFDLQENETDILEDQNIPRLIIGYDTRDNILRVDKEDIIVHESLHYSPTQAISLTSLSEWRNFSEKYQNHFDQIIFYHAGLCLESFVDSESDLVSFILILNKMLKSKGKIIFRSVKINAHCVDIYGYDINFSRSQLVDYLYADMKKIYNFKNTFNISKKYLYIIESYIKLCKKFNFTLNFFGIEKLEQNFDNDEDMESVVYLSFELEKMS